MWHSTGPAAWWRLATDWPIATLVVLALAVHFAALGVYFAIDDFGAFADAAIWPVPLPSDFVAHRFLSQPALFYVHRAVFGAAPLPYHLSLLLLHCANGWLLCRCLLRHPLGATPQMARMAAVVFVAHPAAHTPLAWISAGFNEIPTVTGALVALLFFLDFVSSGRRWCLLLAVVASGVTLGLNQHAVFGWTYLLALGAVVGLAGEAHGERARRARRVASGAVFPLVLAVWFWQAVLPKMFVRFGGAYVPDWDVGSLATAAVRLAAQTLNPLPLARAPIGGQPGLGVPHGLDPTGLDGLVWQLALVLLVIGASFRQARESRSLRAWTGWCVAAAGSMVWAIPLSGHLMDYYVYPSLPAAAVLLSGPLVRLLDTVRASLPAAPIRQVLAITLLAALVGGHARLYASNGVVEQARRARAFVDGVASRPGRAAHICFVPPSEVAHTESAAGLALSLAAFRKGDSAAPTALFPPATDTTACANATADTWLASFEPAPSGSWHVVWLDRLTRTRAMTHEVLEPDTVVRQRFEIGSAQASILEVPLEWRGRTCSVDYRLMRFDHSGGAQVVSGGRLICEAAWNRRALTIPVPTPRSPGDHFELELSVPAGERDGTVLIPVVEALAGPSAALTREGISASRASGGSHVLAYRLLLGVEESPLTHETPKIFGRRSAPAQ